MMDVYEKFLRDVSYKFPKGYPDMDNSEDKEELFRLLNEIVGEEPTPLQEGGEESIYDDTIRRVLELEGDEEIPSPKGNYSFKTGTFEETVSSQDKSIFDKLFNSAPPKKGETKGETKGVGNGEIALYWLYNFGKSNTKVTVGRSGDDPDLFFNGKGVEVKAFTSHVGKIALGRFGTDKENLELLGIMFGVKALSGVLGSKDKGPAINPTNFRGIDLIHASEQVLELERIPDLERLASQYTIFATIKQNIDTLNQKLDNPTEAKEAAQRMAAKMVESKLSRKPGNGNYLANVLKNGSIKFFHINFDKLDSGDLLDNFATKQSSIYVDFGKIFG